MQIKTTVFVRGVDLATAPNDPQPRASIRLSNNNGIDVVMHQPVGESRVFPGDSFELTLTPKEPK